MWSFESPHARFDDEGTSSIGDDPDAFARTVISTIAAHEGRATLALGLHGIGLTIGAKVPDEMWDALATVIAAVAPRRPTVLLLSEEAYVPWELATMPTPIDPTDHRVPRSTGDDRPMGVGLGSTVGAAAATRARRRHGRDQRSLRAARVEQARACGGGSRRTRRASITPSGSMR